MPLGRRKAISSAIPAPLASQMVFLGGCATGLLLTDVGAPPLRVTRDVDVITELASLGAYQLITQRIAEVVEN